MKKTAANNSAASANPRLGFMAAAAFVLMLLAGAVWLVTTLSDQRKLDRCLSSGRKNCIELPQAPRSAP